MKRYKNRGSTISVYLEQEIIDKLDKVAEELNESRSYVIRSIILNATGGKQNENCAEHVLCPRVYGKGSR